MKISTLSTKHKALGALFLTILAAVLIHLGYGLQVAAGGAVVGMAWAGGEPFIQYLITVGLVNATSFLLDPVKRILAKTANYTVLGTEGSGTVFTNRAAVGAVTYALPAPAANLSGVWYEFMGVADQTFTVSAGAGLGVAFNNAACASLACSTGGQKIGAVIRAYCDGTSWILQGSTIGVTYTVA